MAVGEEDWSLVARLKAQYAGTWIAVAVTVDGELQLAKMQVDSILPDELEAQTWDVTLASLLNNLNRIRHQIVAIAGVDWGDAEAAVLKSTYNANTIIKADSDDTPIALTVAEQRLVGRITDGVITGLTAAQVKTLLGAAAASGLATLDASSLLVQNLNASKITAGDIAAARMSANIGDAISSKEITLTTLIFDYIYAIKRDVNHDGLLFCGGLDVADGARLLLYGEDQASVPGFAYIDIGSITAGYNLTSQFIVRYLHDGTIDNIFAMDKTGNITTVGTVDGVDVSTVRSIFDVTASDNLRTSHDALASTNSSAMIKVKTITIDGGAFIGTMRIKFDLKTDNASYTATGTVYRNGVAVGSAQQTNSTTYVTKSQDISGLELEPGDTLELWLSIAPNTDYCHAINFRVYFDMGICLQSSNT